ncbi:hypothetical protein BN1723_013796 [Verticillium longisporum]|uniref:Uncharacterized protein n=1 Tax=Verticillium longisporum TaxID=100787 RepID=A0A0G4L9N3_VERLO|nr:hypothetical protein BN1708_012440 [Verticillium longisporum]CRK26212.1 hypothetical protein BN1723_013796 [Verticillium longisporum]
MAPLGKIAIISIAAFAIASSAVPLTETAANGGVVDLSERSAEVLAWLILYRMTTAGLPLY